VTKVRYKKLGPNSQAKAYNSNTNSTRLYGAVAVANSLQQITQFI